MKLLYITQCWVVSIHLLVQEICIVSSVLGNMTKKKNMNTARNINKILSSCTFGF